MFAIFGWGRGCSGKRDWTTHRSTDREVQASSSKNERKVNWRISFVAFFAFILTACFHDVNHPPTANAGVDVVTSIFQVISLDGTQSSDVDGDSLTYVWSFVDIPADSQVSLSDSRSATPQLTLDLDGQYVIQLVVSDGDKKSKPDFVTISTFNEKPVAVISELSVPGGNHYVIGDVISVSAVGSHDAESQNLFYTWEITVRPDGSEASLSSRESINPTFSVDVAGHYIVHLIVSDGANLSKLAMIIFEISESNRKSNSRPFADAGIDQIINGANTLVYLDGDQSYDIERDVLSFRWEIIYKPENSNATLSSTNGNSPQFTADIRGSYVVKLIVSDGDGESHLDTVIITSHSSPNKSSSLSCGDCHSQPQTHQLAYDDCGLCHTIANWEPVGGHFHAHGHVAMPDVCEVCHNGVIAQGKNAQHHIVTTKECNYCHFDPKLSWLLGLSVPVTPVFDHVGIKAGCVACHNNEKELGKPNGHMPTSGRCLACHTTESWSSELHLEHTEIFSSCSGCHNGVKATGKISTHIVTQQNCIECHKKTSWVSPKVPGEGFDHTGITESCISCHNNGSAKARWRSSTHINATNNCAACHAVELFRPVTKVDHLEVIGECVDCHDGVIARTKSENHLSTTDVCGACHSTLLFLPVMAVDHSHKVGACSASGCHGDHKGATHISTTNNCDSCHFSVYWLPTLVNHEEVFGECDDCHDGVIVLGQPTNHISTTSACEFCHFTGEFWRPTKARLPHSQMLGMCEDCHNSSIDPINIIPASHPLNTSSCGEAGCHSTTQWQVLKPFHHSSQTTNCLSCHDNVIAIGKLDEGEIDKHLASTDACEACHNNDFWRPVNNVNHNDVVGTCESCHDGVIAKGKTDDHIIVLDECGGCHVTQQFIPVHTLDHSLYVGSCARCHNGVVSSGQAVSHISTTDLCEECHSINFFGPVIAVKHSQLTGECIDCHNGIIVLGKLNGHVESGDNCLKCHETEVESYWGLHQGVHFNVNLPCILCHESPAQHTAVGVLSGCDSCHISASWGNPARSLLE